MQINRRGQKTDSHQHVTRQLPAFVLLLFVSVLLLGCGSSESGSKRDWTLERQDGKAVLSIGKLTVVFENIPMKGGDQILAKGFFKIPAPVESREPLSGGRSYNELTIKESWKDSVNTILFNDYSFQLIEDGTKIKFGDKTFAIGDKQTIIVAEDGTASVKTE